MEMQRTTTPISQQVNKELAWNWNGYFGSSFLLHMRVTTFLWNKKKHYEKFQQEKVDDASRMFLLCSFYKSAETTFFFRAQSGRRITSVTLGPLPDRGSRRCGKVLSGLEASIIISSD
jgi:hypothetical protein